MFGNAALVGGAVAPLALVNAAGVVADDEDIHVLQEPRGNPGNGGKFRRRLDEDEFAEQIETPAQVVNVTAAARAAENGAAEPEDVGAKFHRVLGQPLAAFLDGVLADQPAETNLELQIQG